MLELLNFGFMTASTIQFGFLNKNYDVITFILIYLYFKKA